MANDSHDIVTGRFTSRLTDELVDKFCEAVETLAPLETAAKLCGVHADTYRNWLKIGREWIGSHSEDEIPIPEAVFTIRLEQALAIAEHRLASGAERTGTARDYLEILARRFPDRWAKRERIDIGNPDGEVFAMLSGDLSFLTPEEMRQLREILEKVARHRAGADVIELPARRRAIGDGS